jgi:hypothetical protein
LALIEAASTRTNVGGIGFDKRVGDGTNIPVERMPDVAAHPGLQREPLQIGKARAALAAGGYGTCEVCGSYIRRRPTGGPARADALRGVARSSVGRTSVTLSAAEEPAR